MATDMSYRVDFYDGPASDKAVINSYEPSSIPYLFSVGDFVNPFGWGGKNPLSDNQQYQITAVEHQITLVDTPESTMGQHNVAVSLKAVQIRSNRKPNRRPPVKKKRSSGR
jgi:hypothetical protein